MIINTIIKKIINLNLLSKVVLFIPIFITMMWHSTNSNIPSADAIDWLMTSSHIVSRLTIENNIFGFFWDFLSYRPWRPIIFHLFVTPILLITGGNILLTVGIVHTIFTSLSVYFLNKIFRIFSSKLLSALAAAIITMTVHVQFGGIEIPLFAEIALIPFSFGAFYFLIKTDFFLDKRSALYFSIFVTLALLTRPVEGLLFIIPPLITYIFYGIYLEKINFSYFLGALKIPLMTASVLFLSRIIDSESIRIIDPGNSYRIYLNISYLVFIITTIVFVSEYFVKNNKKFINFSYLKKSFLLISILQFLWWIPYFSDLYEWIYRTSFGDIVSTYEVNNNYFSQIKRIAIATGAGPLIIILFFSFIAFLINIFSKKGFLSVDKCSDVYFKMKQLNLVLISSIIIPLSLFLFTIQGTTDRKISAAVISFYIIILLYIISSRYLKNVRQIILIPILLLQMFAAISIINTDQNINNFQSGSRTDLIRYVSGTLFPFPVNVYPNPHITVIENLEIISKKYNIHNIATPINESSVPVDPFTLSLLAIQKNFSSSFPYTKKYIKDDFSFLSQYDSILLINPLGKMEDSKKHLNFLEKIQKIGALKAGFLKMPASNNQKYTFLLQYYYAKNSLESLNWEKLDCFDINIKFSGCVFLNKNLDNNDSF